jgi:hypothetical protein
MAYVTDITTRNGNSVTPAWAGDMLDREHLLAGGSMLDKAGFRALYAFQKSITADVAAGGTSVTLASPHAVPFIPKGSVLYNSVDSQIITLAEDSVAGDTVLEVEPLLAAVATATALLIYAPDKITVPSGTLVGRTYAERDAGTLFGVAAHTDDEFYIAAFDVTDILTNNEVDLYRPGSLVYENMLPGYGTFTSNIKTKLRAVYQTTKTAIEGGEPV